MLTRSAFGPQVDLAVNRRRLDLMRDVTFRSLAAQDAPFTWLVALHPEDPLLDARLALVRQLDGIVIDCETEPVHVPWSSKHGTYEQQLAASAYFAGWVDAMDPGPRLQTRLDDDDALTSDHLGRIQLAAATARRRTIFVIPAGVSTDGDRWRWHRHEHTLMQTLFTPAGDDLCVYDFGHRRPNLIAPVVAAPTFRSPPLGALGWLYLRHPDAISPERMRLDGPLTDEIRERFPISWATVS